MYLPRHLVAFACVLMLDSNELLGRASNNSVMHKDGAAMTSSSVRCCSLVGGARLAWKI